ncbi:MAG: hypothetical protein EPO08_15995 [Rhodospirillaceae bacterium]|nr:MAG: hypothetical protein EPO08_15995 [Rhodospirillaceae bacterium]
MSTFSDLAPHYRNHGFWARPVKSGTKACKVREWQNEDSATVLANIDDWLKENPNPGIGLLMGSPLSDGTCLAALDVDRDEYVPIAQAVLRRFPCARFGSKGAVYFVRVRPGLKNRKFRVKGEEKDWGQVAEFLHSKSFCVLPPTIHPGTGKPYEWIGTPLTEVDVEELPLISEEADADDGIAFEMLEAVFTSDAVPALLTGPETHEAALRLCGQLVAVTTDREWIRDIVASAFPPGYDGANIDDLERMIDGAMKKGYNKQRSKGAVSIADLVLRKAAEVGFTLYQDSSVAYLSIPSEAGGELTYPVRSTATRRWLRGMFFAAFEKPIPAQAMSDVIETLDARAIIEGEHTRVNIRTAGDYQTVFVDLGDKTGTAVRINAEGWSITAPDLRFYRSSGLKELPTPVAGGSIAKLRQILNMDDENWYRLLGFLIGSFNPSGPLMCLLVEGEQGSGKSLICSVIKRILDPNVLIKARLPKSVQDLMITAQDNHVLIFDNASWINAEMSDALCSLATEGSFATRKLYADNELQIFSCRRPFVVNGIADVMNRADLQERAIVLQLSSMAEDDRRTEKQLLPMFQAALPEILGGLYDAVACALRNYEETELPKGIRMADAAQWISAAEPGLGVPRGSITKAIIEAQNNLMADTISSHPVLTALQRLTPMKKEFIGTVGELFTKLMDEFNAWDEKPRRDLPKTAQHLSKLLRVKKVAFAKAGVSVEFLDRGHEGQRIRVTSAPQESFQPSPKLDERV